MTRPEDGSPLRGQTFVVAEHGAIEHAFGADPLWPMLLFVGLIVSVPGLIIGFALGWLAAVLS